jgi:hypothetical protein
MQQADALNSTDALSDFTGVGYANPPHNAAGERRQE